MIPTDLSIEERRDFLLVDAMIVRKKLMQGRGMRIPMCKW